MASPTSPTAYSPESREFCFGIESVAAGTAATVITHEVAEDITIRYMRNTYQSMGFRKAAATRGKSYVTQRHVEVDIKVCYHAAGFGAFVLGCLQGNGSEGATTGTGPYIHPFTPNATGNRMNTVSLWLDWGDHAHVQKCLFGVISSWSASINPDGALEIAVTVVAKWPTFTTTVTPTNYVGSTANYPVTPVLGSQGTYTIQNGAGAAYTNNVLGCTLNFARTVAPLPNATALDPADINANEIVFTGSMDWEYDGIGANTVHADYLNYANQGASGTLHTISFTNADSYGFAIDFYYLRWTDFTPNFSGSVVTCSATLSTEHDESQLDQATPALTAPKTIRIVNGLSAAMTT